MTDANETMPHADAGRLEPTVRPRTCATCAHRSGTMMFGKCMLSGYYLDVERRNPSVCGQDFERWRQREPLLRRVQAWLYAA